MTALLSVRDLTVEYRHHGRVVPAVRTVGFEVAHGETLGVVGESGCGKSTLALALCGLLPAEESAITSGEIVFGGQPLTRLAGRDWRGLRGARIGIVFQDPFSALNPVLTIRYQLQECRDGEGRPVSDAKARALLEAVQLADPNRILASYPHQLSGGQRQRVMIAMAIAGDPDLLIADEPTTALDVTVQDEILTLLHRLQTERRMAMVFVTHNLGLVGRVADRTAVLYAGQIVEIGKTGDVLKRPKHPYTAALLRCIPSLAPSRGPIPTLEGQAPDPSALPSGCPFHPRCEKRFDPCDANDPSARAADHRSVRCHLY